MSLPNTMHMKITAIRQQIKQAGRYSVFVDDKYAFSLSETALLESKLTSGQELSREQLADFKRLSADDKLRSAALRYVATRSRSVWEVQFYLQRKGASPALIEQILNKLSITGLLDDKKFAETFVGDRQLLRPTSRRKIIAELRKKRIPDEVITQVMGSEQINEQAALQHVIAQKRRQSKYQDTQKLMQYLARQGFNYDDIKSALAK
jgi:regulatory protein